MTIVYMRNRQLIAEMHRPVIATHGRAGRGCGRAGAETEAVAGAETEAVAGAETEAVAGAETEAVAGRGRAPLSGRCAAGT